jgi:hypothetical protein
MSSQINAADDHVQSEAPARPSLPHARICPVLPASSRQGAETLGETSDSAPIPPGHQRACADTSGHQADNSGHAMPAPAPTDAHQPSPGQQPPHPPPLEERPARVALVIRDSFGFPVSAFGFPSPGACLSAPVSRGKAAHFPLQYLHHDSR